METITVKATIEVTLETPDGERPDLAELEAHLRERLVRPGLRAGERMAVAGVAVYPAARLGDQFLSVQEVAERYGVGQSTVRKWCRQGLLEGAHTVGVPPRVTWVIPAEALEGFTPPRTGWRRGRPRRAD